MMSNVSEDFQVHVLGTPNPRSVAQESMAISFETFASRLESFDRLHFDLDGSFVWRGSEQEADFWQLDGMVYDCLQKVHRVELKGNCEWTAWRELLRALGHPPQPLTIFNIRSSEFSTLGRFETEFWSR